MPRFQLTPSDMPRLHPRRLVPAALVAAAAAACGSSDNGSNTSSTGPAPHVAAVRVSPKSARADTMSSIALGVTVLDQYGDTLDVAQYYWLNRDQTLGTLTPQLGTAVLTTNRKAGADTIVAGTGTHLDTAVVAVGNV